MDEPAPDEPWTNPFAPLIPRPGVTIRLVDLAVDYEMLQGWWAAHGWPAPPKWALPALGVIAVSNCMPVAAAWVYMDNSGCGVAMIEWVVGAPDAHPRAIIGGIRSVVEYLRFRCAEEDLRFRMFLITCKQPGLAVIFEKSGFVRTDDGMYHLISCK